MAHVVSWKKYIDKTSANKVRPLLVEALNESKHLLAAGFRHVTAMDGDEHALSVIVTCLPHDLS